MGATAELRQRFLDFFAKAGHQAMPSAPLVPLHDPSLLFTNAGMVPFKNFFMGAAEPPSPRLASVQKCLRAGGKHNDLDNVGETARHHTFFEMLGNFSFGDYFKEEAIALAWQFVRTELDLPPARLWVTVYAEDEESHALWRKIAGLKEERILRIASEDNFWSMGETGPCGPCSEIFFDHGEHLRGGRPGSSASEGERFVEIWNLVFMQYDAQADGTRRPLPKPCIDTGAGLERLSAVVQGQHDNYAIDVLRHVIEASAHYAGQDADGPHRISHRVIADHVRAASFLIADGILPANEGRGYVLRRILRRALRHVHLLGVREPLLWRLAGAVREEMGAYAELGRAAALIEETLRQEETRFGAMLGRGLGLLEEEVGKLGRKKTLPGAVAFRLYDTYGFPLDLTEDALRSRGMQVERKGFDAAMAAQKKRARAHWAGARGSAPDKIWFALQARCGPTEFLGYQTDGADALVEALLVDGKEVDEVRAGQRCSAVLNQTPFYAEAGGQIGDCGTLRTAAGACLRVEDVQKKLDGLYVHAGALEGGRLRRGDAVAARIDGARRADIRAHHSATHLLHSALRKVLGEHVTQKGSLVAAEKLRFDFSHARALSPKERAEIERMVNAQIRTNGEVRTQLMAREDAMAAGALALFGEKYADEVRVLSMGEEAGAPFSVELCGGTHVARLGEVMLFQLTAEQAVSSGVRRVEAVAGLAAHRHAAEQTQLLQAAAAELKIAPPDLPQRLQQLLAERKEMRAQLRTAQQSAALADTKERASPAASGSMPIRKIGGVSLLAGCLKGVPPQELRALVDAGKKQVGSGVVALVGIANGKAGLAIGVSDDLTERFDAVALVRLAAAELGGKGGGGRRDMAQAGGPRTDKAEAALDAVRQALAD